MVPSAARGFGHVGFVSRLGGGLRPLVMSVVLAADPGDVDGAVSRPDDVTAALAD